MESTRATFAHEAVLHVDARTDEREPGAVITIELCGAIDHPPPCPFAPHQTVAAQHNDGLYVRTVFAVEAAREREVHERIDPALAAAPAWRLERGGPSALRRGEAALGARMAGG